MWKKVLIISLARFTHSKLWKLVNFRTVCAKKLFKDFICFICRIRNVNFSELVKGICHLSAARRQIGYKTAVFWSVKNWIWSGKSQWKVREFCFHMRVATLIGARSLTFCLMLLLVPLILYFLQAGGVIDHKDGLTLTALHHACARGQTECVKVLLRHGGDPNIRDKVRLTTELF